MKDLLERRPMDELMKQPQTQRGLSRTLQEGAAGAAVTVVAVFGAYLVVKLVIGAVIGAVTVAAVILAIGAILYFVFLRKR